MAAKEESSQKLMTHRERILNHLKQCPGLCDGCLATALEFQQTQAVQGICSKAGSGVSRTKGICAACVKDRLLNGLGDSPATLMPSTSHVKANKPPKENYVREEDLRVRFNASLIETLGVALEDYYGRLDFDQMLRLKEGLARIHDIVTLKLTTALVERIFQRFGLTGETRAEMHKKVNATHPNTSGFDVDWKEPNLIGEVKGCIPVNGGNVFGAAQLRGLTNDVVQMLGQVARGKEQDKLATNNKINRPLRTEAIKLLGLYDSPAVRAAAQQWRQNLMRHALWLPLASSSIEELPTTGDLSPNIVYLVYLKPHQS